MDGGNCNIPRAFLKKRGDNESYEFYLYKEQKENKTHSHNYIADT